MSGVALAEPPLTAADIVAILGGHLMGRAAVCAKAGAISPRDLEALRGLLIGVLGTAGRTNEGVRIPARIGIPATMAAILQRSGGGGEIPCHLLNLEMMSLVGPSAQKP